MKGYAMLKIGEADWIEKEKPACGPMDAICKPLAVALCTSDVHTVYEGAIGERKNMILGHECSAEVVEVGSEVKDFKPGDKVIVPAITPDWNSEEAQAGWQQHSGGMLAGWKFSNFKDGVFADFFHVNDADGNLAHLPESIDPIDACILSDMVPTGFHAVEQADVQFGDTVLVIGIGAVGLMAVRGTALRGASRIICVGSRPISREVAAAYGADEFISYKDGPISDQVLQMTDGKGVDRVCIAGGTVDTFAEAVKCLKPGGRIGSVNYLGKGDYIKIPRVEWGAGMGNKVISGGLMPGGRLRMEKLAALVVNGRVDIHKEVTHVFHGKEHVAEALELMREKPADLIKPVVVWE
ncbi:MAG: NAD(P)-dependent alcohol dehydrogenase [Coriobacteriales bacterium]|jgi:threonine dehydrogenase-like Zn-dependent dehydrogenase